MMWPSAWMTSTEWQAMALSLQVAAMCVAVTLVPGVACGWLLARRRFPGKLILEVAVQLPMVMPPVLVGYLLIVLLGRGGWIGAWLDAWFGVRIAFTLWAAVLASAVVSLPLMVRSVRLAVESLDAGLEQAARTCGASPVDVLLSTVMPAAWPGILTGMVLAFMRSLGEFGATILFAGNIEGQTRTLPLALFRAMETPGASASVTRLALAAVALSVLAVLVSEYLNRRALAAREAR
jgi:molybdate transport system permease protein